MGTAYNTAESAWPHARRSFAAARNHGSPHTWSRLARCTAITAYTSETVASFTTRVSSTDFGTDRWRRFLSTISLEAAASGFDTSRRGSIATKWWNARVRAWANAAIDY